MHADMWIVPQIIRARCQACGTCERLCPTQAVAVINRCAIIVEPDRCSYCAICEDYCPHEAIERFFEVCFAPRRPLTE